MQCSGRPARILCEVPLHFKCKLSLNYIRSPEFPSQSPSQREIGNRFLCQVSSCWRGECPEITTSESEVNMVNTQFQKMSDTVRMFLLLYLFPFLPYLCCRITCWLLIFYSDFDNFNKYIRQKKKFLRIDNLSITDLIIGKMFLKFVVISKLPANNHFIDSFHPFEAELIYYYDIQ